MMICLDTNFSPQEKEILCMFEIDVLIMYLIDSNKLKGVSNPNRIIYVEGYYLCEEKEQLLTWYMGSLVNGVYDFWANYGDLRSALEGL